MAKAKKDCLVTIRVCSKRGVIKRSLDLTTTVTTPNGQERITTWSLKDCSPGLDSSNSISRVAQLLEDLPSGKLEKNRVRYLYSA